MAGEMLFQVIKSEGLAHMSYLVGHKGEAAVIDPRRDCEIYQNIAHHHGMEITHIFETHRNEDYVIGSLDLAHETGAEIYHGKALDFKYGNAVEEGDTFDLGDIKLGILETPGHTFESISITLHDTTYSSESPIGVFTGDALFVGDVGRTDFFPDRAEEVAGLLYDSVFNKLLPLGDHVMLFPAHGAGSVCGGGMADREFSTLGFERQFSPVLQKTNRKEFINHKINEHHYQPSYFRKMEEYNQYGAPPMLELPDPRPMKADLFATAIEEGMTVVDVRSPEAFAGAFIPGSYCIPVGMLSSYAGYFLSYDDRFGLVADNYADVETAMRHMIRMGYDNIHAFLDEGLHEWETSGRIFDSIGTVSGQSLAEKLRNDGHFTLLDVRKIDEYQEQHLPQSCHLFLGELQDHVDEIPRDKPVTTFCGSGIRAMIAASILKRNGFDEVVDNLGSMQACVAAGCPIIGADN